MKTFGIYLTFYKTIQVEDDTTTDDVYNQILEDVTTEDMDRFGSIDNIEVC